MLRHLDDDSKRKLFGNTPWQYEQGQPNTPRDRYIRACLYIRLKGTRDHKQDRNMEKHDATYFIGPGLDGSAQTMFALVRSDGAVMLMTSHWKKKHISASWLDSGYLAAEEHGVPVLSE